MGSNRELGKYSIMKCPECQTSISEPEISLLSMCSWCHAIQKNTQDGETVSVRQIKPRKEERAKVLGTVLYSNPVEGIRANKPTTYVGETLNLSSHGACIITKHAFNPDDFVKVTFNDLSNLSVIATVRWCLESGKNEYRIGLHMPKDISEGLFR